jgi:hypothetical protein
MQRRAPELEIGGGHEEKVLREYIEAGARYLRERLDAEKPLAFQEVRLRRFYLIQITLQKT